MLNPNDLFAQIGFIVDSPQKSSRSKSKFNKYKSHQQSKLNGLKYESLKYKTIEQQFQKPQYTTSLEIELSQNQNHILEIKSYDDPHDLAVSFCMKHNLNKLAVEIVEKKIIEAKLKEEDKINNRVNAVQQQYIQIQQQRQRQEQKIPQDSQKRSKTPQRRYRNVNQKVNSSSCNQQFLKNTPYTQKEKQRERERKKGKQQSNLNKTQQNISRSVTPSKIPKQNERSKSKSNLNINNQKTPKKQEGLKGIKSKQILQKACDNLYLRGLLQAKALQQKRIKHQQQKQRQQQQELTFKPKINQVSEKIIQFRKQTGTVMPKNPNKMKKQLTQQFYKQLKQCTFTPEINPISKIIVHNRQAYRTQNQHFNQLFNNTQSTHKSKNNYKNAQKQSVYQNGDSQVSKISKENLKKQQQIEEKQMFKPKFNQKSIETIKQPFYMRLQKAIQIKQRIKQGQYMNDQYSFQPTVGRSPYYQLQRGSHTNGSNKQNIPIWQQLYRQSQCRARQKQKNEQQKALKQKRTTANNSQSNFQSNGHNSSKNSFTEISAKVSSNLYYENLIQKRINVVFQLLDSDGDGVISPNTIGIQNLSKKTLIFLKPIFQEMDQLNAELDYNDFRKAVINLLNDSDPYKKGLFLTDNSKNKFSQQCTFTPKINSKSKEMIQGRISSQIHVELYEQGIKALQRKQFMLEKQRARKQQKLLQQCSFKPQLKLGRKNYQPHIFDKKLSEMQRQIDNDNVEDQRGLKNISFSNNTDENYGNYENQQQEQYHQY